MGKLHELLAVEKDLKSSASKILAETRKTFSERSGHFNETKKVYSAINEEDKDIPQGEYHPMVTTVKDKLDYTEGYLVRLIDAMLQKEKSNQEAKADVYVTNPNGEMEIILKDAPVTFLVQMETLLQDIRSSVYDSIPTLDPMKVWKSDPNRKNVFDAEPVQTHRTKKVQKPIVLYDATDKHPAQTQLIVEDLVVGYWTTHTSSGSLSPKQKSDLLDRIDRLISGVKIARAKANDIGASKVEVGRTIFTYINEAL